MNVGGVHPDLERADFLSSATMTVVNFRRRTLSRLLFLCVVSFFVKVFFFPPPPPPKIHSHPIQGQNFIERATRSDKSLNVQRHPFLQSRMGRDEKEDMFSNLIRNGVRDYWERLQLP